MTRTHKEIFGWNRRKPCAIRAPKSRWCQFATGFEHQAEKSGLPPEIMMQPLKVLKWASIESEQCIWKIVEERDESGARVKKLMEWFQGGETSRTPRLLDANMQVLVERGGPA